MVDIQQQIAYWRSSAEEDWQVAADLIRRGRSRHGLFFAHLALEKLFKAYVCKRTNDLAPKFHNLIRLAEIAELPLSQEQIDLLAEMNAFNLESRYPDMIIPPPSSKEALTYLKRAGEVFQWLMREL